MTPVSVTSTANVDPFAQTGAMYGMFNASPVYNKKPFFDLSNPLVLAGVAFAAWWLWKHRK